MNILLLTDRPPSKNYKEGIFLNQLVKFIQEENHKVCCYAVIDHQLDPDIPTELLDQMPYAVSEKPIEHWGRMRHGFLLSLVMNNYISIFELPKIANEVVNFASNNNIDLIWSVVQGQTLLKLTRKVAKYLSKPYTVQVLQPPECWVKESKIDLLTSSFTMKEFKKTLQQSQMCLTSSWAMAEEYEKKYLAKCTPIISGLPKINLINNIKKDDTKFLIGFSGQIYSNKAFRAFLDALNYMNWQYEDKNIQIKLFGHSFPYDYSYHIQSCGYLEQNQLRVYLQHMDLLYCPYYFDKEYNIISKLSFPSQLTHYLSVGKTVFFHGLDTSSSGKFLIKNNAGFICNTLNHKKIANQITEIISNKKQLQEIAHQGYDAFLKYLTIETMKDSFLKSLGIEINTY